MARISAKRKEFSQSASQSNQRYHEEEVEERFAKYKPGVVRSGGSTHTHTHTSSWSVYVCSLFLEQGKEKVKSQQLVYLTLLQFILLQMFLRFLFLS